MLTFERIYNSRRARPIYIRVLNKLSYFTGSFFSTWGSREISFGHSIDWDLQTAMYFLKYLFSSALSNSVNICRTEVLVEICNIMYN